MRIKLIAGFILLSCMACQEFFLGDDEVNSPENNFELLWNDFDQHYALFDVRKKNWDSIYSAYRPKVNPDTKRDELWLIFKEMIEYLDDSHTVLYYTDDSKIYASGFVLGEFAKKEFSLQLVEDRYVTTLTKVSGEASLFYGDIVHRDVGYIFMGGEDGSDPESAIKHVLDELKNHQAIILDLRTNDGGDKRYAKIIAGAFSDGEHLLGTIQTRNGPSHHDFNEKVAEVTARTGAEQFLKPVVVLTDRATISAGEYVALHMRSFDHVTIIGDSTAGDFSAVGLRRFLPNGWSYQYSIQMFLQSDGSSLDGVGIVPDLYVKNSIGDISRREDKVLDAALTYLLVEYDIGE